MLKIGLLSDTHSYLDESIFHHFAACNEIWHAGDFGDMGLVDKLETFCDQHNMTFRGVYGNIDAPSIQRHFPEDNIFTCEDITVFMRHIGGYPGRYTPGVKDIIKQNRAKIFVSGHSHILKIMFDDKLDCLHINPGAAGRQGWHTVRTAVRFEIDGKDIRNCEVIELGSKHASLT